MNKKQKKLLLECVEHVMEWELHMGRVSKTKMVKGVFGLDVPETKYLKKYLDLKNICKILNA
mgnify:CR=1 FL=1